MLKNKCSVWKRIKFPTFWYNCYYFTRSDTYFIQLETLLINHPSYNKPTWGNLKHPVVTALPSVSSLNNFWTKSQFVGKFGANVLPVQAPKFYAYTADMMANINWLHELCMDIRNHKYFYELCRPKNYSVCFTRFGFIGGTHIFFCTLIPEKFKLLKSALPKITQHN